MAFSPIPKPKGQGQPSPEVQPRQPRGCTKMNKEDIIRMAREATKEAPREDWNSTAWVFGDETLERFAALVASAEREKFCAVLRQLHDSYSLASDSNNIKARG
jgi:hypothetical protein